MSNSKKYSVGIVGLGAMGSALALNFADHRIPVAVYNRTSERAGQLVREVGNPDLLGAFFTLEDLCASLKLPRVVILMVPSGAPVDDQIRALSGILKAGDLIVDGGNSFFQDTIRREQELAFRQISFIGCGVSGGPEGARRGPALMPGGDVAAWSLLAPLLMPIAAKNPDGRVCCRWIGPDGAGHYVKMVHNFIEYGVMELIGETVWLLAGAGFSLPECAGILRSWQKGACGGYLLGISADILETADPEGEGALLDRIVDRAEQKGTGEWALAESIRLGVPIDTLAAAVLARIVSCASRDRRSFAARCAVCGGSGALDLNAGMLEKALYPALLSCYAQGFELLRAAAVAYHWPLKLAKIADLWRGGCILQGNLLGEILPALAGETGNLFATVFLADRVRDNACAWRRTVAEA
ncbi:MAG: NADP-dependent phosphogluconate dehydrogenase, partial [Victivallaceae bacterium]|nr:NADP-dependent phosphogluconate dehydrogenase [Victivallaceae bacterium]